MKTDDLIQTLTRDLAPVRPLASPWRRASLWVALSLIYVAAVVMVMSPRPDLMQVLADTRFQIEQLATFATAIAAAVAAFAATIPGRSRAFLLLPLPPLAVWLASLGLGCIQQWLREGPDGLTLQPDWICFPAIVLAGALPAAAIVVMLRRGAPLLPHATLAFGALAAAALGNFGLRFFHPQDASLMVLIWQLGSVALLSLLAGWAGPRILGWRHAAARA